jgi:rhodanese-related sulfurtransferase
MAQHVHSPLHELAPTEVKHLLDTRKIVLIDVREPHEYEAERIAGALLFPLSTFEAAALPPDEPRRVVFHCGSGKRSAAAAALRVLTGIHSVAHMTGGIQAWKSAGLPVIKLDPETGKPASS